MKQKKVIIAKIITFHFLFLIMSSIGMAETIEPIQAGAYYGNVPFSIKEERRSSYPGSDASFAGRVYLFRNNIETINWVNETKSKMIKRALDSAKKLAIDEKKMFFAIDNMNFDVVHDENAISVYFDCNIIAW